MYRVELLNNLQPFFPRFVEYHCETPVLAEVFERFSVDLATETAHMVVVGHDYFILAVGQVTLYNVFPVVVSSESNPNKPIFCIAIE